MLALTRSADDADLAPPDHAEALNAPFPPIDASKSQSHAPEFLPDSFVLRSPPTLDSGRSRARLGQGWYLPSMMCFLPLFDLLVD